MSEKPDTFDAPPRDDEIDDVIAAKPWVLRTRLTQAAYTARCAQAFPLVPLMLAHRRLPFSGESGEW